MPTIRLPNNWRPRNYQRPAWDYLERGGRHAELVWHRRAGKDEICLHRAACAAFERVANYWHMLPEAAQARKAIWSAVNPHTGKLRIDEAFPLEIRESTNNTEMMIRFKNGSSWQVVGSDNFNSLVGSAPAGIVYSEWALANPTARAYLRPILLENGGWQLFITTSRGRNHAYTTLKAAEKTAGSFAQILRASDTGVFTLEQLEAEKRAYMAEFGEDYGLAKFEQEYECSFDAANLGAILAKSITQAEHAGRIGDHIEYDPNGAPIEISCDLGRRDTATWWFWQPVIGGYHLIDYDGGWGIDAEEWSDRLESKLKQYKRTDGANCLGRFWMPHDAKAKTFGAKRSAEETFALKFGWDKVRIVRMTSKADRINAARILTPKVAFNSRCERGLDGLRSWSYEYNEETKTFSSEPLHDWASHDGDGYSYGCQVMQEVKPPEPSKDKTRFDTDLTINEIIRRRTMARIGE